MKNNVIGGLIKYRSEKKAPFQAVFTFMRLNKTDKQTDRQTNKQTHNPSKQTTPITSLKNTTTKPPINSE